MTRCGSSFRAANRDTSLRKCSFQLGSLWIHRHECTQCTTALWDKLDTNRISWASCRKIHRQHKSLGMRRNSLQNYDPGLKDVLSSETSQRANGLVWRKISKTIWSIWFSQWNSGFPGVIFSTNPQGSGSGGMNAGLKASEMVQLLNVAQEMGFIEMSAWWMIMICPCNIYIYIYIYSI